MAMALFTADEFLVALDDLHEPELGIKKMKMALQTAHPHWKPGINTKNLREALAVLRGDGGAAMSVDEREVPKHKRGRKTSKS